LQHSRQWEPTTQKLFEEVHAFAQESLSVNTRDMRVDDIYRLPSQTGSRPVLVRFAEYHDRQSEMSAFREKRKRDELPVRVGQDLPSPIDRAWHGLYPRLCDNINDGNKAYYQNDKLVVDGMGYVYDVTKKVSVREET